MSTVSRVDLGNLASGSVFEPSIINIMFCPMQSLQQIQIILRKTKPAPMGNVTAVHKFIVQYCISG
jgi:hypothetical protein